MDKPTGGYWFPYLEPHPKSDEYPWRPAYRSTDGTLGRVINLWCETAGDVMAYLNRSGLAPAWSGQTGESLHRPGDPYGPSLVTPKKKINPVTVTYGDEFQINPWPTVPLLDKAPVDQPPDDRSEWIEEQFFGQAQPTWIRGRCHHKGRVPVESVIGDELLAWWCADCGEQFDPERWPAPEGLHITETLPEIIRPSAVSFVDTYADPELIGPEYPKIGITVSDVWGWYLSAWNKIKAGFRVLSPGLTVIGAYVLVVVVTAIIQGK